ncbi:ABC transporter substrate-binding protein [Propionicimonas sp.]|uniref:ABC transporter substrate-binding protein n=1 Tax=Propionicimonas sp. TaxID=1955623 RepID=UPI0017F451BD|nr:ABC transporter substrate-binding protein [Propionicimonas sp.]MBU3977777.1 ABC transporter substrate-binding protein [Actinomycetota bacterium]MBA3021700.1 ABC transporter substrate-binding protein [Propionicimonas sp.]MBU3987251.1 ABC transporter substrate-binding protein [Actinomycetota bacterium]MBU4009072.1 ABC transporter substrate-binding protein [Actinomycetota bacterium]MBU4065778.1 ABC transporter substrate-binding protein [Actinomycetota bacterium]
MKKITGFLALTLVAVSLSACASGNPLATPTAGGGSAAGQAIVVGSANFPESELLAEIYAGALKAKGITVTTKLNIASRETYVPALKNGEIDLIPEYTGAFAKYLNADADTSDEAAALASLRAALPATLQALEPSAAQDKDSISVTQATADKYSLTSIEDLAQYAPEMVLGGPPEWKERAAGVPGLEKVYGLRFKAFKPLDVAGPLTVQALKNGQVQAANLFTTDPAIKANGFVVLDDPKSFFGAQNVIPVITKAKATPEAVAALNGVSAKLDTDMLATLVTKVVVDKADAADVAAEWLKANGLS